MSKVKILIADDHPIVREGYKKILMDTPDMQVVDEAGNGQEVLNLVRKKDYDLILLDISMPGRSCERRNASRAAVNLPGS